MIYKLDKAIYSKEVFLEAAYTFKETAYLFAQELNVPAFVGEFRFPIPESYDQR